MYFQGARREDLVKAVNKAGGWHTVSKTLGLQLSYSLREVYFKCPPNRRSGEEIEFTLPGMPQRFAATVPVGVEPGDEFIVRVPPVLPSAAHGFANGLNEAEAKQRLVLLAEEMDQMKLMQHEIGVIKRSLRAQDGDAKTIFPTDFNTMDCPLDLFYSRVEESTQVRKTPSWPRSWTNSAFYSCIPTGMHRQTCTFWGQPTTAPFSLQRARAGRTASQSARKCAIGPAAVAAVRFRPSHGRSSH